MRPTVGYYDKAGISQVDSSKIYSKLATPNSNVLLDYCPCTVEVDGITIRCDSLREANTISKGSSIKLLPIIEALKEHK